MVDSDFVPHGPKDHIVRDIMSIASMRLSEVRRDVNQIKHLIALRSESTLSGDAVKPAKDIIKELNRLIGE